MSTSINDHIKIYAPVDVLEKEIIIGKSYHSSKTLLFILKNGYISFFNTYEKVTLTKNTIFFSLPNGIFELKEVSLDADFDIVAINTEMFSDVSLDVNRLDIFQFLTYNYFNHFTVSDQTIGELHLLTDILRLNLSKKKNYFQNKNLINILTVIIYTIIEALSAKNDFIKNRNTNRKQELVLQFLKLLSENYRKERNVSFYADQLSVTVRHLSATIKIVTQKTASQIIHQYIISESKILLTSSNKNISQIASLLGFNDQYYFSRFFKKHTGLNPSTYKTQNS